jgi:hypothetical protein
MHSRPTLAQIRAALVTNVTDEVSVLREKIMNQAASLEPSKLQYFPYEGEEEATYKPESEWVGPAMPFFTKLLDVKKVTEVEKIAFRYEGDDQVMTTALSLLLLDYGIDLHDYNMNLRQIGLTFHEEGLIRVYKYLGIPNQG